MKNIIVVGSYEGVSGYSDISRGNSEYVSKELASDINCVADISKKHGYKVYSFCPEAKESKYLFKYYANFLNEVESVDSIGLKDIISDCIGVVLVGISAKAGTINAFLDKTYKDSWWKYSINGKESGLFNIFSTFFAINNIPVILMSGCYAACIEAKNENDDVLIVETKRGIENNRNMADCIPVNIVREKLSCAMEQALTNINKYKINKVLLPVKINIEFIREDYLEDTLFINKNLDLDRIGARVIEKNIYNTNDIKDFLIQ